MKCRSHAAPRGGPRWPRPARKSRRQQETLNVAGLEQGYVDAAGREILEIGDRGLPFCAGEGRLNGGDAVKLQDRDQVIPGGAGRSADRALADFILAQAGNLLGERDVLLEIMLVERGRV